MVKEIFIEAKVKDVRRILTSKNKIEILYKIKGELVPIFDVVRKKVGKLAMFDLTVHMDIDTAINEKFLKWYSNKEVDYIDGKLTCDRKNLFARVNFTKSVYLKYTEEDFLINLSELQITTYEKLDAMNEFELSYVDFVKQNSTGESFVNRPVSFNSTNGKVRDRWTASLYMDFIQCILNHLGLRYIREHESYTWYYLGYTMTTKIISFGWIGEGTCYRPRTTINDKKMQDRHEALYLVKWPDISFFSILNTINMFHKIGKFSDCKKLGNFQSLDFVNASFGDIGVEDTCMKLEIIFGIDIRKKLIDQGYDQVIVGYDETSPYILDTDSGKVEYCPDYVEADQKYEKAKINNEKVLVTKTIHAQLQYGYILDLY